MTRSSSSILKSPTPLPSKFDDIGVRLACFMIGRTVDMFVDARTIARGIVTGVLTEAGVPKLVMGGKRYDVDQILTATPSSFN